MGIFRTAGVSVTPARIALTATPFPPSSSASCRTWDRAPLGADTALEGHDARPSRARHGEHAGAVADQARAWRSCTQ